MSGEADDRTARGAAPDGRLAAAPGQTDREAAGREIRPAREDLDVTVRVPGSKSITNRALLLAALADGTSTLHGALDADDTAAFAGGVRALGVPVDLATPDAWRVQGRGGPFPVDRADVYCADAGTAARFLLAACAAGEGEYRFDASPQLRRRPLAQLLDVLRAQGARTRPGRTPDACPSRCWPAACAAAASAFPATPPASSSPPCSWRRRSPANRWRSRWTASSAARTWT